MPKLVVVLGGTAGSGKDTFARFLADRFTALDIAVRLDAYAWALKQITHLKYGIPLHVLNADKAVKESTSYYGQTVRQILQREGWQARQDCGNGVWAERLFERLRVSTEQVSIITDARVPDEEVTAVCDKARELDARFFVVRIRNSRVPLIPGHPTEDLIAAAPDSTFDFLVENEGSLADLAAVASSMVDAMLVLHQSGVPKITSDLRAYSAGLCGFPYINPSDAEAMAADKSPVVSRDFMHLKGSIIKRAR